MKMRILLFAFLIALTVDNKAQTVTDYDGNVYNTVTIGTQVWMAENLKVTHYRNGNAIPNVIDASTWSNLTFGARCYYDNDSVTNVGKYGALYNWYAVVDSSNICPLGWHIPTDTEWTTLTTYLGGTSVAGGKLKETGTTHWQSPNTGATNSSGFTALPGGFRYYDNGSFLSDAQYGFWWSATEVATTYAWDRYLTYNNTSVTWGSDKQKCGLSVRCVKDSTSTTINNINYNDSYKIYPNPATNRVYINCTERQDVKMQVHNMIGVCVLQRELNNGTNDIDISFLSKGIYIITFSGANWTIQHKLVKE